MSDAELGWYELINPSDAYEFQAPDDALAEAVTTLLSSMAGWRSLDGEDRQGGFADLAHRDDSEDYVAGIKATISERRAEVVAALRSVEINPQQRIRLGVDPDVWHDEMRTSMSDFRSTARSMADQFAKEAVR